MDIKKLTDSMYIFTRQLIVDDLPRLKELGIKTIITNRPDGEIANQTNFIEIKQEANKLGIDAVYIPVYPNGMTEKNLTDMKTAIENANMNNKNPVIAYCRTATRSTRLWALSQLNKMPAENIKKIATNAGYDVSDLIF